MISRRRIVFGLLGTLAVLGVVGHWLFWYSARLRPATPADDMPARLLDDAGFESALWVAYPHQNLPVLADRTGLDAEGLAAALRLAGVDAPGVETSGRGVRLPPASSLAVAVRGDQWAVAVHVYPASAAFVRLAGFLAGNPWFAGGPVALDEASDAHVRWRGTTWIASSQPDEFSFEPSGDGARDVDRSGESAIAWIRLGGGPGAPHLPGGRLSLRADDDEILLATDVSEARDASGRYPSRLDAGRQVLDAAEGLMLLVARSGGGGDGYGFGDGDEPDQALLLLPQPAATDVSELPRAAVLHRAETPTHEACRRWDLPAESLLKAAGHERPRGAAAGWQADATDAIALGGALAAAPELRDLAERNGLPAWGLWLDVVPAARELDRLARGVEGSPLVRRADQRRWLDAARLLESLARRPARVEGWLEDGVEADEMVLRWTATGATSALSSATSPPAR